MQQPLVQRFSSKSRPKLGGHFHPNLPGPWASHPPLYEPLFFLVLSLMFSVLMMLLTLPGFSHSAPGHWNVLSPEELREAGLSRQKAHRQDGVNGHVLITSSKRKTDGSAEARAHEPTSMPESEQFGKPGDI